MNSKKAFTLVELLAVITIIGVLALIALPTIEKITKENQQKVYQQQLDNIVLSLKSWASDNKEFLPENENENLTVTLGNLKSEGYIEYDVKNTLTNKCFDNSMALIITKVKKNYDYSIDLNTIKESDSCEIDTERPFIILQGNMIENVEVNSVYVDKGVIAKDKDGNNITDKVTKTITGSGNVINTSELGNQYLVTYSIEDNEKVVHISRTVKIVDTIAPDIYIPNNLVIDDTVDNIDVLEGVSVTDNSGETIEITSKSNVKFGSLGKYTITYVAMDSSGNKVTKRRTVHINEVINGAMSADTKCIKDKSMICPRGTEVYVKVNNHDIYKFYVVKDTGDKLSLLMEQNLSVVRWQGTDDNSKGPINVFTQLNNQTSNWTNLGAITSYTYVNNLNGTTHAYGYRGLSITNGTTTITAKDGSTTTVAGVTRARLLTREEAIDELGCDDNVLKSCIDWAYGYLDDIPAAGLPGGYWFLTASYDTHDGTYYMGYTGKIHVSYTGDNVSAIRPVIDLYK